MALSAYLTFLIWFLLLILGSYSIDRWWASIVPRRWYRLFITPGIVVHELSHAVACVVTGARIHSMSFFAPHGGEVRHGPSRLGFVGSLLIGVAPLIGISLSLWGLTALFGSFTAYPTVDVTEGVGTIGQMFATVVGILQGPWNAWTHWLFLWLALSLAASLAPSSVDLKHALGGIVVFAILGGIVVASGNNEWFGTILSGPVQLVISLGALLELLALAVTLPAYALSRFLRRS